MLGWAYRTREGALLEGAVAADRMWQCRGWLCWEVEGCGLPFFWALAQKGRGVTKFGQAPACVDQVQLTRLQTWGSQQRFELGDVLTALRNFWWVLCLMCALAQCASHAHIVTRGFYEVLCRVTHVNQALTRARARLPTHTSSSSKPVHSAAPALAPHNCYSCYRCYCCCRFFSCSRSCACCPGV